MDNKKIFDYFILNEFCESYKVKYKLICEDKLYYFRYLCFKLNFFIKHIPLPKIKKESLYESVLVEFREFPHIEFIIRNTILKLGSKWSYTVICGNLNYDLIAKICTTISPAINIIKINKTNIIQSEYSKFLTTLHFWNLLKGEKILIYQEDSLLFKNNIDDFLEYDYIGAPFPKNCNDTPNSVGNGGLSIRSKSKMIEIIKNYSVENTIFNSSTINYMNLVNLTYPPEDIYFSKNMQENRIGIVADWDTAYNFSSECIFNPNSFGGHKFWISYNEWTKHMNKTFHFFIYKCKSDLYDYLNYIGKSKLFNKINNSNDNNFDIDLYFFCKANNFEYNKNLSLKYVKNIGLYGFIYHPNQLLNIFPNLIFYHFLNNIFVFYNKTIIPVQDFVQKNLYTLEFDIMSDLLIKKSYSCLNDNYNLLILVFIGNENIGIDLINKIIKYKKIQSEFNIAFCFNSKKIINFLKIKELIKNNFDFYAIYKSKELGTDITPTLLMYNDIIKKHKFTHILKFHTKSIKLIYNNLTNYLISKSLDNLILNKTEESNCIGDPNYYVNLFNDNYNNKIKNQYLSFMNINKKFIGGTIFYCPSIVFNKVLFFFKTQNYRMYLLNNLYENNSINKDFSPIHFLERLFGVINI
jgi:hypothetical protein